MTVGLGDMTPQTIPGVILLIFFDIIGLELFVVSFSAASNAVHDLRAKAGDKIRASALKKMMSDPGKRPKPKDEGEDGEAAP